MTADDRKRVGWILEAVRQAIGQLGQRATESWTTVTLVDLSCNLLPPLLYDDAEARAMVQEMHGMLWSKPDGTALGRLLGYEERLKRILEEENVCRG